MRQACTQAYDGQCGRVCIPCAACAQAYDGQSGRVHLARARHAHRRATQSVGGRACHVRGMHSGLQRRAWAGVLTVHQACTHAFDAERGRVGVCKNARFVGR